MSVRFRCDCGASLDFSLRNAEWGVFHCADCSRPFDLARRGLGTDRLPRALGDPLRGLRTFLTVLVILQAAFGIVLIVLEEYLYAAYAIVFLPLTLCFLRILPRKIPDAIYLRSFRNDSESGGIRVTAQAALGRSFRLTGIRDPRRRWPVWLRTVMTAVFLFRYATPKYMNLEAGDDWQVRLWRTLTEARCVLLDLTDLTHFVEEEVRLAFFTVGLQRTLFVVDATRPLESWRDLVVGILKSSVDPAGIQFACWRGDSRADQEAFATDVRTFRECLPTEATTVPADSFALVRTATLPEEESRRADRAFWVQTFLGLALAISVTELFRLLAPRHVAAFGAWWILVMVFQVYLFQAAVHYFIDCGSRRERIVFSLSIVTVIAFYLAVTVALARGIENVRELARLTTSQNNLKRIGVALHQHAFTGGRFPGQAIRNAAGRPLLSWRVALLPNLGEEALHRQFRLDEPWDSPHNRKLLDRMPAVYSLPTETPNEPGRTHYQILVGPRTLFAIPGGPSLNAIPDGTGNTIAVVEAENPVPWTKPEDLPFDPANPRRSLGGHFRRGTNLLMMDGTVVSLRPDLDDETIRSLADPTDGRELPADWRGR